MTSSRFPLLKNHIAPVSPVIGTACPAPLVPMLTARHATSTRKRLPFRQSAVGPAEQAAVPRSGGFATAGAGVSALATAAPDDCPAKNAAVSETLASWSCGLK